MKATNKTDLEIGNNEIAVSLYKAIDDESSFNLISSCCNSKVNYKKVCSSCGKELQQQDIKKALKVGDEYKEIDSENIKAENGNLKVLGTITTNGDIIFSKAYYYICPSIDKKNKARTERTLNRYAYLRESLKGSEKALVGEMSFRGKKHLLMIKPYYYGLIGCDLVYMEQIRDIQDTAGYSVLSTIETDKAVVKQMTETLKVKQDIKLKDIENEREKKIEQELTQEKPKTTKQKKKQEQEEKEVVAEIVNF